MFIRIATDRLINSEKVIYFELVPYLNVDKARIEACLARDKSFIIFEGTMYETQTAFCELADALTAKDKTLFDFTEEAPSSDQEVAQA